MYEICCGEGGLSPQHFFYHMSAYEAEAYVRGVRRRMRAGWEQARYVAFNVLKPWAKDLDMDNMPHFSWEDEPLDEEAEATALANLQLRVGEYKDFLNNNNK